MTTRGRNRIRKALIAAGLTVASLGVAVTTAAPAVADGSYSGRAYVWGSGVLGADWDDEGANNVSTHRVSNVTCLWQYVLQTDGYLNISDVDGVFGDQTHAATVRWQQDRGLTGDGSAGRDTWARAGNRLHDLGVQPDGWRHGYFNGSQSSLPLRRSSGGNYQFWDADGGVWRSAAYNTRSCR
jgi:hypothetical protein